MSYYYAQQPRYQQFNRDSIQTLVLEKLYLGLLTATAISIGVVLMNTNPIFAILAFVGEIIAIIGYFFAKKEGTIEKLYYLFVASSAVLLGFSFQFIIAGFTNGLHIIIYTFGLTALIVGYSYNKAANTHVDLVAMNNKLRPFSLIFIALIIIGLFVSFGGLFYLIFSFFGAILFSYYLYYDMNRLMQRGFRSPSKMAWNLYWDILLIFKYILRILLMLFGDRR